MSSSSRTLGEFGGASRSGTGPKELSEPKSVPCFHGDSNLGSDEPCSPGAFNPIEFELSFLTRMESSFMARRRTLEQSS